MWDNRSKKTNPKAPDFKCKDKDCDGVIWPPRGAKTSAPAARSPAPIRNGNDDRSNRIERQHSQEMAIRYAALKGLTTIDSNDLRTLIDWFQRDIGHVPASKAPPPTPQPQPDESDEQPF